MMTEVASHNETKVERVKSYNKRPTPRIHRQQIAGKLPAIVSLQPALLMDQVSYLVYGYQRTERQMPAYTGADNLDKS
jgi:hypothetical protein